VLCLPGTTDNMGLNKLPSAMQAEHMTQQIDPMKIAGRTRANDVSAETYVGKRVHMVGMGGAGMEALAALLLRCGAIVSGSDEAPSEGTDRLAHAGATVHIGHATSHLPAKAELVVASAAVPGDNPELTAARLRGTSVLSYAQMLGEAMRLKRGIAVAGTHGKSTTTALTAFLLREAGLDPSFVVGAQVDQLGGGSAAGGGEHFVAEACEYQKSFLHLRPRYAVILNIEEDHLDYYSGLGQIIGAFGEFADTCSPDGLVVANGDDPTVCQALEDTSRTIETFGLGKNVVWQAANVRDRRGRYAFDLLRHGQTVFSTQLGIPGRHNVLNATAAAAIAWHCGVEPEAIVDGLGRFGGVSRRLSLRGQGRGIIVADDYAHHPTEIRATLEAAREAYRPARLWAIFQPHQHSRTRFLLDQFASSFSGADIVIVPDIYFVRDSEQERATICAADLVARLRRHGREARYCESFDAIAESVKREAREGDLILTMGAGDIWKVTDELVCWLG